MILLFVDRFVIAAWSTMLSVDVAQCTGLSVCVAVFYVQMHACILCPHGHTGFCMHTDTHTHIYIYIC